MISLFSWYCLNHMQNKIASQELGNIFCSKKKKWKRVAKIEILPKISCKTQVGAVTLSKTDTGVPAPTVRLRKVSDWKRHGQDLLVLWKKKLDMSINGLFLYELCLYFEVIWKGTQKFLNV